MPTAQLIAKPAVIPLDKIIAIVDEVMIDWYVWFTKIFHNWVLDEIFSFKLIHKDGQDT